MFSFAVTAGSDTSSIALMWVVIYMARNPECQRKMQQEIQHVLGEILIYWNLLEKLDVV